MTQPNSTVTGVCAAGTSVQITAAKATVTLTGHCAAIVITADGVSLKVDQFDTAFVSGAGDTVTYHRGTGAVTDVGTATTVTQK